jgi:hypothetical protein
MTGKLSRRNGDHYTTVELDESSAAEIRRLGMVAYAILSKQDLTYWENSGATGVLPRLIEGAVVLQRLGYRSGRPLLLDDDGTHLAFVTCCALALMIKKLDRELKSVLGQVIGLLATCCPVEVALCSLPPIRKLPKSFRTSREIQRQYQFWRKAKNVQRDIPLSDALTLLQIFQTSCRPEDIQIINRLIEITEGLRTALLRIRETGCSEIISE